MKTSVKKSIETIAMTVLAIIIFSTVLTATGYAISSRTELFKTDEVTLTGDQAKDICIVAKAQTVNNSLFGKSYLEPYCDNFVVDCARMASVSVDIIPSDQGDVNHLYNGLKSAGAKIVQEPHYGDIILYKKGGSYIHAALYTLGSGVNTKYNRTSYYDSVQGNLGTGSVIKESLASSYNDGKGNTVGNGISIVYMRPNYKNNAASAKVAADTNAFNKNMTDAKNGEYVLGTSIKYYSGPSDKADTYYVSRMADGAKVVVTGYYNGFVRLGMIASFRGKKLAGDGREISKTWGAYVKFTDLSTSVFNGNKKSVDKVYVALKDTTVSSAPCAEGRTVTTLKKGQYIIVAAEGVNHVKGHVWLLLSNGLYVYKDGKKVSEVNIGKASLKKVSSSLSYIRAEANAVKNCNIYQFSFYKAGVYAGSLTMNDRFCSFKGVMWYKYTVKVRAGVKAYDGTVKWGDWSVLSKPVQCI